MFCGCWTMHACGTRCQSIYGSATVSDSLNDCWIPICSVFGTTALWTAAPYLGAPFRNHLTYLLTPLVDHGSGSAASFYFLLPSKNPRQRQCVFGYSIRQFVNTYFTWRDICGLSGSISMRPSALYSQCKRFLRSEVRSHRSKNQTNRDL